MRRLLLARLSCMRLLSFLKDNRQHHARQWTRRTRMCHLLGAYMGQAGKSRRRPCPMRTRFFTEECFQQQWKNTSQCTGWSPTCYHSGELIKLFFARLPGAAAVSSSWNTVLRGNGRIENKKDQAFAAAPAVKAARKHSGQYTSMYAKLAY